MVMGAMVSTGTSGPSSTRSCASAGGWPPVGAGGEDGVCVTTGATRYGVSSTSLHSCKQANSHSSLTILVEEEEDAK